MNKCSVSTKLRYGLLLSLSLLVGVIVAPTASGQVQKWEPLVIVAVTAPGDSNTVRAYLLRNGIRSFSYGSLVYSVHVPKSQVKKAKQLLKKKRKDVPSISVM